MERHEAGLEAEANQQHHDGRCHQPYQFALSTGAQDHCQLRKIRRACCTVEQGHAVEHHGRCSRTIEEVLQSGLT